MEPITQLFNHERVFSKKISISDTVIESHVVLSLALFLLRTLINIRGLY